MRKCGHELAGVEVGFPFTNRFFCDVINFEHDVLTRAVIVAVGVGLKHDSCIADR